MREVLITSSVLILALLALRRVFRKTISRRVQYALWALVLARLLIPAGLFQTPATDFSVLTAAAPVQRAVSQRLDSQLYYSRPIGQMTPEALAQRNIRLSDVPTVEDGSAMILMEPPATVGATPLQQEGYLVRDADTNAVTLYEHMAVGPWEILSAVWKVGMAAMALFFLTSNLAFYLKLRKHRREIAPDVRELYAALLADSGLTLRRRVYLVDEGVLPSPCLFGLFSPAIYLTPAALQTEDCLRHVLCHESTHARHLDPLWSLLRCVCLTVYWFDPLVWAAALCSKTDCELACDESVLEALGENERIGYGETLLSLIPVKRGNPLIAATTMTAGKRQLRDRITRIAQRPRQLFAAVLAVAMLVTIAAACTFTSGMGVEAETSPSPAEDTALRSLTALELKWFNEKFFNASGPEVISYTYNIRNQFANPINLYDKPEDIDLYELFYLEGSPIPDEELSIIWEGSREDLPCPAYKINTVQINDILMSYTGLTLDKANKESLTYTYSPEHNAYYWMHGDTNYPGALNFTLGTREGDIIKLYHQSDFNGSGWYCVTLRKMSDWDWRNVDIDYRFVSNQKCDQPAIPALLPDGKPILAIDLGDLEPYTVPAQPIHELRPASDFSGGYENRLDNWNFDGHHIMAYVGVDGLLHCAVVQEDGSFEVFLTMDKEQYGSMFFYHGLFGYDGFYVDHTAGVGSFPQRNYYYFTDDGVLHLLLEAVTYTRGGAFQLDLDGDGHDELVADNSFFFQREGKIYQADLPALLAKADPKLNRCDSVQWDVYSRSATVRGTVEGYSASWTRHIFFDGGNLEGYTADQKMGRELDKASWTFSSYPDGGLLVYTDEKPTADHMVKGIDSGVPSAVVKQAKAYVENQLEPLPDGTWVSAESAMYQPSESRSDVIYDNWRIESFDGPYREQVGDALVETWAFNYELHTTTPENVILAGGRYLTEDGWVSPGYPGCDWLIFRVEEGENAYTFLWHEMSNDMGPGSPRWSQHLEWQLAEVGVEVSGSTAAARDAAEKLEDLIARSGGQVTLMLTDEQGKKAAYTTSADETNGPYYQRNFTDPESFRWQFDESSSGYPEGAYLTITDPSWEYFIRIWEDSDLVMIKPDDDGATWYQVEAVALPPDDVFYYRTLVFPFMRGWFYEAEWSALTGDISIPDEGQSHEAVAQAWVDAYEGAKLLASPNGSHTCTYVKNVNVEAEALSETPERWFPEDILDYDHFRFSYSSIFVPENADAENYMMAGNTAEYEGDDPSVPDGAFQYWLIGSMYLKDGRWYCASLGTG